MAGAVCEVVKEDLDKFVNGAEQFDDITMLCLRYLGWYDLSGIDYVVRFDLIFHCVNNIINGVLNGRKETCNIWTDS